MKKSAILALAMALGVAGSAFAAEINDKVEINGEVRAKYMSEKASVNGQSYESTFRTRLEAIYKPIENLNVVLMAENEHDFREGRGANHHDINLRRAYLEGKVGKADVTIGRVGVLLGDGNVLDDDLSRTDSLTVGYDINEKVKIEGFVAQNIDGHELQYADKTSRMYGARVSYAPTEKLDVVAEYAKFNNLPGWDGIDEVKGKANIWDLQANYKVTEDLTANLIYIRGDVSGQVDMEKTSKNGVVIGLSYKGADAAEKGTWGVNAKYYNQGAQTYVAHATDGNADFEGGFKGWSIGGDYAIAKNVVAEIAYYDTKDKEGSDKDHRIWSAVTWTF